MPCDSRQRRPFGLKKEQEKIAYHSNLPIRLFAFNQPLWSWDSSQIGPYGLKCKQEKKTAFPKD
jgi:hypothetical protein